MDILKIKNVYKSFKSKNVLKGINLDVPEKSIFGFIGVNGSGKTTTMKAILGLLSIDSGEIRVNNELVTYGNNQTNKFIGYLPDVPSFYDYMTAYEYMVLCAKTIGLKNEIIDDKVNELLSLVGLHNEKGSIKGYSRGMKQRLGIAQALIGEPKLLICDEPTSALDPIGRKEILDILKNIKEKTTVIFSTHILSDIESICTHVAFLDEGIIKFQGRIDEISQLKDAYNYSLELLNQNDKNILINNFSEIKVLDDKLIIPNESLDSVLTFLSNKDIKFRKIEVVEISLEKFFMEVIYK